MVHATECTCPWKSSSKEQLFVGTHPQIRGILANLDLVALSDASVLITGESGTGKEIIARYIHMKSGRKAKPWVAINCAALPRDVIENELFGHEKEAFTGASSKRLGCFELANEGTLFLDEIAETHPQIQAKLLRAIELKSFRRVGGSEEIGVDIRIVAATNRHIPEALKTGSFREDLYYRLSVVEIGLPPLRERQCDIPLLAGYFLCQLCEKYQKRCKKLTPETIDILSGYHWPGNVRELRNVMESLVLVCPEDQIGTHHLPNRFSGSPKSALPPFGIPVGATLAEVERITIERTVESLNNNKSEAARVLGISRKYLYSKLEEYTKQTGGSDSQ
jgi:transcriptional regulator with PAS, ATPase and Fis domain